jgi:hypothetical protein
VAAYSRVLDEHLASKIKGTAMKLNRFLVAALLVSGFAGPAQADVFFSNLG